MRNFLRLVVATPILIVVLIFCVVNRTPVSVTFDPFGDARPALTFHPPLFLALIIAVALGILIGGAATWFSQGRHRRAERAARSELARLARDASKSTALTADRSAV